MKFWIFEDMRLKRVESIEWTRWMENADRRIHVTSVGNVEISTVFWGGVSLDFDEDPPRLFETMIFGGSLDESTWRYRTLGEAKQGHYDAVEKVKNEITKIK